MASQQYSYAINGMIILLKYFCKMYLFQKQDVQSCKNQQYTFMQSTVMVLIFFPLLFYVFQIFCNTSQGTSKRSGTMKLKGKFVLDAKIFEAYAFSHWN